MKTLILSDTHFGVRNNSMRWLKYQLAGLDEIIEYVKNNEVRNIVHCGDVFDSRSAVSPYVVAKLNEKLSDLCSMVEEMFIIGGNHDYYSPEHSDEYDITSLDFLWDISNLHVFTQESAYIPYKDGVIAYMPWFRFNDEELFDQEIELINQLKPKVIFTHTDLQHIAQNIYIKIARLGVPIISGHVHTPNLKNKKRLTIGSCYPIDFNDANSDRGFYVMEDWDVNTIEFHPLNSPIHFWRLYNDEIFEDTSHIMSQDKLEIYINSDKYNLPTYKEAIDNLKTMCDASIIINTSDLTFESKDIKDFDIVDIMENTIPDHLKSKFNILKELMSNAKQS